MRRGGILQIWRTIADMAVEDDESGSILRFRKDSEGMLDPIDVIGIANSQNIPTVAQEPSSDVLGKCDVCVAFDGDVIVVVDPAEIVELEVAGK